MTRLLRAALAAATLLVVLATPVAAHGDHDALPLVRQVAAGPYVVSLWQVYPDAGTDLTPHLIVMFEGGAVPATADGLRVALNAVPTEVRPSTTTANGFETTTGLAEGDVVTITVSAGDQAWTLEPVVVPPAATSMLPMQELIYTSIALTAATAWWAAGRAARAWRRPPVMAG